MDYPTKVLIDFAQDLSMPRDNWFGCSPTKGGIKRGWEVRKVRILFDIGALFSPTHFKKCLGYHCPKGPASSCKTPTPQYPQCVWHRWNPSDLQASSQCCSVLWPQLNQGLNVDWPSLRAVVHGLGGRAPGC